jgi:hypothetical protein
VCVQCSLDWLDVRHQNFRLNDGHETRLL